LVLVSVDRHEFLFIGFVNYNSMVAHLQENCSIRTRISENEHHD
jgi:hypothetical protein